MQLLNKHVLPFYFEEFEGDFLLTNMFRNYIFLNKGEFAEFIEGNIKDDMLKEELYQKRFISFDEPEILANKYSDYYKSQNTFLFQATSLHIFSVTQDCNLSCIYCQVTSNNKIHHHTAMTNDTVHRAVDLALQSPSNHLAFEFQGGEPLLNFNAIREIVTYSNKLRSSKNIEFRLVTNLTMMNDEILEFIKDNKIHLSISLDGNDLLHNKNRPYKNGKGSYKKIIYWINKIIGTHNIQVSALPTITKYSFKHFEEIIQTYINLGFRNIFIRSLSPFGTASNNWNEIGYTSEEFTNFYRIIFDRILSLNSNDFIINENYATMILAKILKGSSINFMDLRSPCGAGIGQIAYNWDGDIYTCDEGRMIAAEGDKSFKIGNVYEDNYQSCMNHDTLKYVLSASVLDSLIDCKDCVYSPICGVCPVYNHKIYGSLFAKMSHDYRCNILKGIYHTIYSKLKENDKNTMEIFNRWIQNYS